MSDEWNFGETTNSGNWTNGGDNGNTGSGFDIYGNPMDGSDGTQGMSYEPMSWNPEGTIPSPNTGFNLGNITSFLSKYGSGLMSFLNGNGNGNGSGTQTGSAAGKPSNAMSLLGSGIAYQGAGAMKGDYMRAWENMLSSDKWNTQASRYHEPLYQAATQGIGNTAYGRAIADATARQSSAKGYNMSGNMLHEIAQGLNSGTTGYLQAMTPLAMGRAPDTRGLAPIAAGVAQSTGNQYNALGNGVGAASGVLGDLTRAWL